MAISDIYNSLTFGGVNSLDYGIYISGPCVFDAPTRDVEFVDVPGRNGAIEIDKGHWNNIEVTYKAGTFGDDQSDFAARINAFRNAIVSQIGYQRITDTYNPEEYRLGIYASGIAVDPTNRNEAGQFDLVFNCKPQRFLISGETPIELTSGESITNPTLFDSYPLIMVSDEGEYTIGTNEPIIVENRPYGDVVLLNQNAVVPEKTFQLDTTKLNPGDTIRIDRVQANLSLACNSLYEFGEFRSSSGSGYADASFITRDSTTAPSISIILNNIEITQGTPMTATYRVEYQIYVIGKSGTTPSFTLYGVAEFSFIYESDDTITIRFTEILPAVDSPQVWSVIGLTSMTQTIGDSTKSILSFPLYIDAETGQSYKIEGGEIINLSQYISLGSDLPALKSGENEILIDGAGTEIELTPRWWEL